MLEKKKQAFLDIFYADNTLKNVITNMPNFTNLGVSN